jgi:DNA-binding protein HU-beta
MADEKAITLEHLATKLSEDHALSKEQTEAILNNLFRQVADHLKDGRRVEFGKFGSLVISVHPAGEPKAIKEVLFRADEDLKLAIKGSRGAPLGSRRWP